jgi:poly-beta-1,6-N-acetyl-D-glucosamine synthase
MIYLVIWFGGIYIVVIALFLYGWEKLKPFNFTDTIKKTTISVIIPMRNEEYTINILLEALKQQNYPKELYEIIVIDDHSSDQALLKADQNEINNIRILSLPENISGKKASIRHGIEASTGQLIITTDADCCMDSNWLNCYASYYEKFNPEMLLGPVVAARTFNANRWKSIFESMQALELFSLLGTTAGATKIGCPIMCNGANLAFTKSAYTEIEHLYNNDKIQSGDDIFALLALKKKFPGKVHFIKSSEAKIITPLPDQLKSFFQQRKRWTAKSKYYNDGAIIITALTVFAVNFLLLTCLISGILNGNFSNFFILFFMKSAIDFPLLQRVTCFFGEKRLLGWFPVVQSFYFLYVCFTVFAAFISPITWKGRMIKQ